MDFFNLLPDHLLLSILSSLPLTDAARTSLLSRRWAHQWADYWSHKTDFNLDLDLLFPTNSHKQAQLVNTIISSPRLTIRKVEIFGRCVYRSYNNDDPRDLAQWAHKLVDNGVNELSLINRGDMFRAPNCLLSSKSLTVLKLQFCNFRTKGTFIVSCTNLKSLELDAVSISGDLVTELVSTCKKLEFLSLDYCCQEQLKVSSQSLVKLHLMDFSTSCRIDVSAPNLEELDLQVPAVSLCLFVPKVKECRIFLNSWRYRVSYTSRDPDPYDIEELLQELQVGIASSRYLQLGGVMLRLLSFCTSSWESKIKFEALKKLRITICPTDWRQTSAVNTFLRSCPLLQELSFDMYTVRWSEADSSVYEPFYCPSQRLDQVELMGFTGYEYEMSILKYIQVKEGVFTRKPKEESNGMAFLDKYSQDLVIDKRNHRVSFKLGECKVGIKVSFDVAHLGDLLNFD